MVNTVLWGKHLEAGLGMHRNQRLVKGKHFEERGMEKGRQVLAWSAWWPVMPAVDVTGRKNPTGEAGRKKTPVEADRLNSR